MLKMSFKIWAAANAMVLLVFALFLPAQNKELSLLALAYSSALSLPAVPVLYWLLTFLRFAQGHVWFSWTVLMTGTAVVPFIAYGLFRLTNTDPAGELGFVLPLGFVCGYSAVLAFCYRLHELFLTFQFARYEND